MIDVTPVSDALAEIVGESRVVTDPVALRRLSVDYSLEPSPTCAVAVRPQAVDELPGVIRCCVAGGLGVSSRGGGMSYTLAHTPAREETAIIDLRDLQAVQVDARDMVVTVEAGCTWERLLLELEPHGLRTPFWGPLSGRRSTVGGMLSQNGLFYGSARHGTAVESVLGLEVVLADGTHVVTGSGAHRHGKPFARAFGPDLTGLFLGDSGAFGVKARADLALLPIPAATFAVAFAVDGPQEAAACLEAMARVGLASELFAFDPFYHSLLSAMGMTYLAEERWSVNAVVEGADAAHAEAALGVVRRAGRRHGHEIPASAPLAMRSDPFGATQLMFEAIDHAVHLPLHGVVPFSRAGAAMDAIARVLAEEEEDLSRHGIRTWLLANAARNSIVIEPTLYFPGDYRDEHVDDARRTALVARRKLTEALDDLGAVHMQLGKYYPYLPVLRPGTAVAVERIKEALDPTSAVGAGALGL